MTQNWSSPPPFYLIFFLIALCLVVGEKHVYRNGLSSRPLHFNHLLVFITKYIASYKKGITTLLWLNTGFLRKTPTPPPPQQNSPSSKPTSKPTYRHTKTRQGKTRGQDKTRHPSVQPKMEVIKLCPITVFWQPPYHTSQPPHATMHQTLLALCYNLIISPNYT